MHQLPLCRHGGVLHDCPVGLLDLLMATEHLVQPRERLARAGEEHHAAGGTVEAMGNAKEDLAGLVVFLFNISLHHLGERCIARLVALHYLAAGLVDGNDMIIFVEYSHRNRIYELTFFLRNCPLNPPLWSRYGQCNH